MRASYLIAVVFMFFSLSACSGEQSVLNKTITEPNISPSNISPSITPSLIKSEYKKITPNEAQKMMTIDVVIIAICTQEEFDDGYIKQAVLLPDDEIYEKADVIISDKKQTVLVYGYTPERSAIAAQKLLDMGYMNVLDFGGISDWTGEIVWAASDSSFYNYFGGDLPDDIVTPIDFTVSKRIHSELPIFTFSFKGETVQPYCLNADKSRYFLWSPTSEINKLTIIKEHSGLIQEITNLNISNEFSTGLEDLIFDDWNFDGYLDFCIPNETSRAYGYFLWNNIDNKYVRSAELEELGGRSPISVDYESNRLEVYYGRMGYYVEAYYEYINGKISMVKSVVEQHEILEDEYLVRHFTVSELIGGEMVVVDEYKDIWQEEYAELLRGYVELSDDLFFLLYDIDNDSIPELIMVGEYLGDMFDAVYTYKDKKVIQLEYSEDVFTAGAVLQARGGLKVAPNLKGIINYHMGPSAGAFGVDIGYNRIIIDGNKLVIDASGKRVVDVQTLNTLFDDFGRNTNNQPELEAAIKKHTYYYINDVAVSEDELNQLFVSQDNDLIPLRITELNINKALSLSEKNDK